MPTKILLIENDSTSVAAATQALEARGVDVRVTGDGKEGLDLAREWAPDAIVLCVELPGMSGYLVCQKLRKDDALRGIPLVITSAEATPDTFEKHRALKVRADEYLLKPYDPAELLEKLGTLVALPDGAPLEGGEEELVSLEEEMGLEALPTDPVEELPTLELQSLPDAEPLDGVSGTDEALSLLDEAFDGLTAPAPPAADEPGLELEVDPAAVSAIDPGDFSLDPGVPEEAPPALDGLDEADAALGALGALGDDEPLSPPPAPVRPGVRGASADLLRAAGIKLLDDAPPPASRPTPAAPSGGNPSDAAISRLERELAEAQQALAEARGGATGREAEVRQVRARAEEASRRAADAEDRARAAEAQLDELRDRLADAERRAEEAEARAEDAQAEARQKADEVAVLEESARRSEALERELDEARAELLAARNEADGARGDVDRKTADLRQRVAELETANAKNEERVLRAYQKIKGDEKVKEKVRKAIAIAAQLLDEGLPPAEPAADKPRPSPAAALLARE